MLPSWSRFFESQSAPANRRLNRPNPRNKYFLRLNSVPRSSISTIRGLNLTYLAKWINSPIRLKDGQKNSKWRTYSLMIFLQIPGPTRKEKQNRCSYSLTDEPSRIPFNRNISSFFSKDGPRSNLAIPKLFHTTSAKQEISTFPLS